MPYRSFLIFMVASALFYAANSSCLQFAGILYCRPLSLKVMSCRRLASRGRLVSRREGMCRSRAPAAGLLSVGRRRDGNVMREKVIPAGVIFPRMYMPSARRGIADASARKYCACAVGASGYARWLASGQPAYRIMMAAHDERA